MFKCLSVDGSQGKLKSKKRNSCIQKDSKTMYKRLLLPMAENPNLSMFISNLIS